MYNMGEQPVKAQVSLGIHTVSPEPCSLLTQYMELQEASAGVKLDSKFSWNREKWQPGREKW